MVRRAHAQRSVFEVLLPDGNKLWDDELRAIDAILEDECATGASTNASARSAAVLTTAPSAGLIASACRHLG